MSTTNGQSPKDVESAKGSGKRRRKQQDTVGKVLRDFLERTGLNDDLEQAFAHVARNGINSLWKTFTPIESGEEAPKLPPEQPPASTPADDPNDPYAVMGVHKNTPSEILKAVYVAWAKHHHPDVGGDAETFKRVNVAWDKIKEERGL